MRSTSPLTTLPLPHKVYNTTEAEYMRWVDEHTGAQVVEFVLTAITKGSKVSEEDREKVLEYRLMKEVVKERFPEMVKEWRQGWRASADHGYSGDLMMSILTWTYCYHCQYPVLVDNTITNGPWSLKDA